MFRIALCENDQQQIEVLLALINKYQAIWPGLEMHTYSFSSGLRLLERIENGEVFDLYLIDTLMPDISGIEFAKELRLQDKDTPLVFFASSTYHAYDAFRVHATQYILKPIKEMELFPVLDRIVTMQGPKEDKYLLVLTAERMVKILFSSIVCVESINRTLRVHLANGTKLESKTIRVPFVSAVAPLLQDVRFLHAHKSFVLNMDWIKEISGSWVVMEEGTEVPVPRYKYTNVKTKCLDYLLAKGIDLIAGNNAAV